MSDEAKDKAVEVKAWPTVTMPIERLAPAEYNPRKISNKAKAGLDASLQKFGLVQPIVWNKRTGRVVGGHQRLKLLARAGIAEVPTTVVDLSEAEEKALNVALNNPEIQGTFTDDIAALVAGLKTELPDLGDAFRFDEMLKDLDLAAPTTATTTLAEDEPAPPPPREPITRPGDLWILGRHRLLCGDSTDRATVLRLIGEDPWPVLMVTDPPYGVVYDPEWRDGVDLGVGERSRGKVQNDDRFEWIDVYKLFEASVAYVWHAGKYSAEVSSHLQEAGFGIVSQIIWAKQHFAISRGDYHWQHEPCWYAVKKGAKHNWQGARDQSTLWQIANNNSFGNSKGKEETWGHGTQKPIECMARPIRNNSAPGELVCDPFVGSGTTLDAAEQLDRRCLAMEIDPGYCDVVVARWEKRTGKKAERLAGQGSPELPPAPPAEQAPGA